MQSKYQPYAVISVIEPVLQQPPNQSNPPYVTYQICGKDPHGEFNMRRRFRQFFQLREKLVQRFIGLYIPPIPPKKATGNTEQRYVEQRRTFLHYFCQKIAQRPYLFDSDIFQTFIRGDPDFQRASRYISNHQYALIANIYDVQFKKLADQADLPKILLELQVEQQMLKTINNHLTATRDQIAAIAEAKNHFVRDFGHVFTNILPKYQKYLINKHDITGDNQILSNNQILKASLDQYLHFCQDNPLQEYAQMINYDIREARALLEALESRKNFENKKLNLESVRKSNKGQLQKLKSGRTTIKSIFTPGNKEYQIKQLETHISTYQRNQTFMGMCSPLSAISIHKDIIQYKSTRSIDYLGKLQVIARKQIRLIDYYGNFLNQGLNPKADQKQ